MCFIVTSGFYRRLGTIEKRRNHMLAISKRRELLENAIYKRVCVSVFFAFYLRRVLKLFLLFERRYIQKIKKKLLTSYLKIKKKNVHFHIGSFFFFTDAH